MKTKFDSVKELFHGLDFYQYVALGCIFVAGVIAGCFIQ
jgi:hypothetical protein